MDVLKKRQRLTDHDDLVLLREVLGLDPFEDSALWLTIQEHICSMTGKTFNVRTLRCRLELLIKLWLDHYKTLKDKSGIEVTETEKDILCHNIYDIMKECKQEKRKKTPAAGNERMGIEARKQWTASLQKPQELQEEAHVGSADLVLEDHVVVDDHSYTNVQGEEIIIEFADLDEKTSDNTVLTDVSNILGGISESNNEAGSSKTPTSHNAPTNKTNFEASTSKSKVFGAVRSRKRKITAQKQGLEYLHQYDKQQAEMKKRELDIAERKLLIEERKMDLEEKQFLLMEFKLKKKLELQEKQMTFEADERKSLKAIIEKQDTQIQFLLNKLIQT
ncbi:unnamed protein product [Ceutorhynchus assimilis]|uniref:Uncharacterized protein n=1 Tax=Ceutorhynchus assimilis TaxID=467358 RepID=A0A9N9MZQ5_9CUCU|nr:unnamed protein product [Ceutorhynchus assimilis]